MKKKKKEKSFTSHGLASMLILAMKCCPLFALSVCLNISSIHVYFFTACSAKVYNLDDVMHALKKLVELVI